MSIRYLGLTAEDVKIIEEEIKKCGMSFAPTSLPAKEGYFRVQDENGVSKYVPASDVLSFDETDETSEQGGCYTVDYYCESLKTGYIKEDEKTKCVFRLENKLSEPWSEYTDYKDYGQVA